MNYIFYVIYCILSTMYVIIVYYTYVYNIYIYIYIYIVYNGCSWNIGNIGTGSLNGSLG